MDQQTVAQPGTVNLSTTLDPNTVNLESGGGAPSLTEQVDTGSADDGSVESVLEAELALIKAEEAKKDEKPEAEKENPKEPKAEKDDKSKEAKADEKAKDEKPARERAQDGKFAKKETAETAPEAKEGAAEQAAAGQEGSERSRPSEGRQHIEPPARFLPKEREAWGNVPNVVKSAIARVTSEHETELQQYRSSHEEWTKLDKFQQMAKQHNTNVADALDRYTKLDGLLSSNPIEGIRQILATRGITPEQYAQHVLNNPGAHKAPAPQPQPDPAVHQMSGEVQQLKQTIESMRLEQAATSIVIPFMNERDEKGALLHPRYQELENDIAFFLESGKIPASLSPQEKLETAYDMAVRINPTSAVEVSQVREAPAADTERPAKLDAGKKSIRGAPDDGADTEVEEEADDDIRDMLRKQMRRMSA